MKLSKRALALTLFLSVALAGTVITASPASSRKPEYWTRTDFARLTTPFSDVSVQGVNDAGDAVGTMNDGTTVLPLVRYAGESVQFVSDPAWTSASLQDLNEGGAASGYALTPTGFRAFTYDHGTTRFLAGPETMGTGINDAGVVAVNPVVEYPAGGHASLWMPDDTVVPLDAGGYWVSIATDVANGGWAGGAATNDGGPIVPVRWTPSGDFEQLALPNNLTQGFVFRINSGGNAAGFAFNDDLSILRAVKWIDGVPHRLGSEGNAFATGINDRGNVVGASLFADGNVRGTVWNGDGPQYVDDLTSNKSAHEHFLTAISNNVTIAGQGAFRPVGSVYSPNNGLFVRAALGKNVAARTRPVDIRVAQKDFPIRLRLNLSIPLNPQAIFQQLIASATAPPPVPVPTLP